jgi:hypothetical protein
MDRNEGMIRYKNAETTGNEKRERVLWQDAHLV